MILNMSISPVSPRANQLAGNNEDDIEAGMPMPLVEANNNNTMGVDGFYTSERHDYHSAVSALFHNESSSEPVPACSSSFFHVLETGVASGSPALSSTSVGRGKGLFCYGVSIEQPDALDTGTDIVADAADAADATDIVATDAADATDIVSDAADDAADAADDAAVTDTAADVVRRRSTRARRRSGRMMM